MVSSIELYIISDLSRTLLCHYYPILQPTSRLGENQNKEKELFLEIASSLAFSCNASPQQEF